jgi:hypothetical protein
MEFLLNFAVSLYFWVKNIYFYVKCYLYKIGIYRPIISNSAFIEYQNMECEIEISSANMSLGTYMIITYWKDNTNTTYDTLLHAMKLFGVILIPIPYTIYNNDKIVSEGIIKCSQMSIQNHIDHNDGYYNINVISYTYNGQFIKNKSTTMSSQKMGFYFPSEFNFR